MFFMHVKEDWIGHGYTCLWRLRPTKFNLRNNENCVTHATPRSLITGSCGRVWLSFKWGV